MAILWLFPNFTKINSLLDTVIEYIIFINLRKMRRNLYQYNLVKFKKNGKAESLIPAIDINTLVLKCRDAGILYVCI